MTILRKFWVENYMQSRFFHEEGGIFQISAEGWDTGLPQILSQNSKHS